MKWWIRMDVLRTPSPVGKDRLRGSRHYNVIASDEYGERALLVGTKFCAWGVCGAGYIRAHFVGLHKIKTSRHLRAFFLSCALALETIVIFACVETRPQTSAKNQIRHRTRDTILETRKNEEVLRPHGHEAQCSHRRRGWYGFCVIRIW
jgi:hypothetical protein